MGVAAGRRTTVRILIVEKAPTFAMTPLHVSSFEFFIVGVIARNGPNNLLMVDGACDRDAATLLRRETVERRWTFGHRIN